MTDLDALHRTILDNPADDTARLVYADALDDSGKPWAAARAELIRLQVRRQGAPVAAVTASLRREEQILKKWGAKWLPPLARLDRSLFGWEVRGDYVQFTMLSFYARYVFERGFPSAVLLEHHHGTAFDARAVGEFVRECLAARPLELVELRLTGHAPALTLKIAPHLGGMWRAVLTSDDPDEDGAGEYVGANRKTLVAGMPNWMALELAEVEFERVVDYHDDAADDFDIPF